MNRNPFSKRSLNLTRQMEVFAESPTKARQFKAEAEESDRQMAQRVAPAVEVITRALADEVYRAAPSHLRCRSPWQREMAAALLRRLAP